METRFCKNCTCFIQHYVLSYVSRNFIAANCGHCLHKKAPLTQKSAFNDCAYFCARNPEQEKTSRNETVRDAILGIHKKLNKLLEILQIQESDT